jgi:hypothetical protein
VVAIFVVARYLVLEPVAELSDVGDAEPLELVEHVRIDAHFARKRGYCRGSESDPGLEHRVGGPTKVLKQNLGRQP